MTDLERYYEAKEAYYNGQPIMTDLEFDEFERSIGLENKSEVGTRHNPSYTIKHPFIMGSLSKVQIKEDESGNVNWEEYYNSMCSYTNKYCENPYVIMSPKYDGCSFEVVVDNGRVFSISSRGDGEYGKNLYDHLFRHINNSVGQLSNYGFNKFVCRGEVLIKKTVFESKYSEFVNPRSFVSGVLNRDYTTDNDFQEMLNDLSVVIYDIRYQNEDGTFIDTDFSSFEYDTKPKFYEEKQIFGPESFKQFYELFAEYREECEYILDGFVIKPSSEYRQNNLVEPRPKDCVAIKFIPMLKETVIEEIIWSTRKTNELIPVIKVRPVIMDGKEVSRASAHNYGYLVDNKISVGTTVILSLAGDIIPFIYKVTDTTRYNENNLCIPKDIETYTEGCHLYKVLNEKEITKKKFLNSAISLNIPGLGPSIAEKLFDYIDSLCTPEHYYEDFFIIEPKELPNNILLVDPLDISIGIGGKIGNKVCKEFEKILKTISLKDIILSLCIEDCGPKIAEQIEKHFLTNDGDFSHMSEKAYSWALNKESDNFTELLNIIAYLKKSFDDFKTVYIAESSKVSDQIPVILTGEPNNYTSKGEFLKCNPQYRLTGSWKEVKIVFTNSLESNTGKMKKAREKNIEIKVY